MRAALFRYDPTPGFVARYLHDRIFDFKILHHACCSLARVLDPRFRF